MNVSNILRIASIIFYVFLAIILLGVFDLGDAASEVWMDTHVRGKGILGIIVYTSLVTLLVAMGVPRQICSLMGGYVFGLWQGTLWATIGTALACIICFSYARFVGQDWLNRKYGHKLTIFNDFLCQSPFLLTLVVRIVPLGSNFLTNFLAGISRIPAIPFLGGSIVGFTAQNFIFAMMGSGLQMNASMNSFYSIILYIISLSLGYWVYLRYKKHKKCSDIAEK